MNKNTILNDFLKLKKEGVIEESFSNYEELLNVLSKKTKEDPVFYKSGVNFAICILYIEFQRIR